MAKQQLVDVAAATSVVSFSPVTSMVTSRPSASERAVLSSSVTRRSVLLANFVM